MNRLERGCYFDLIQAQRKFHGFTVEQARKILGTDFESCWPAIEMILMRREDGIYYIEWLKLSEDKRAKNSERQRKRIQDYWDNKKQEKPVSGNTVVLPRNNHGITVDIPKIENENENIEIEIKKGVQGEEKEKEKGKKKKPELNLDFISPEYGAAFNSWLLYKAGRGEKYKTQDSLKAAYDRLVELSCKDPPTALAIVKQSMANNWAGLFSLKSDTRSSRTGLKKFRNSDVTEYTDRID
ncbi:MAG: hypothetical protein GT597_13825 [Bacteroidales bacterium]|nr:hypothetical protein [Bacteroidales bacterium]